MSPAGSHKPNTAIAQAYYNKEAGVTRLATETGAGQWGSALAVAGALFGLECKVYMVQGLLRPEAVPAHADGDLRSRVVASPSPDTNSGRTILARDPDSPAAWASPSARRSRTRPTRDDTKYSLGSVLNHVLLHQTVIGQEALKQMEMAGDVARRGHRLRRRRHQLRGPDLPVPGPEAPRARTTIGSSRSSPRRRPA